MCIGFASQLIVLVVTVTVLQACSFPKHSNTLVFGTNTKIALDVSADPTGKPNVTLGYKRQEAVWMPLRVNKKNGCTGDENCMYVGKDSEERKDTYSVLASFGAEFAGDANAEEASSGLAQYFATGLAARELVRSGGAALVNTGQNAITPDALRNAGIAQNKGIIARIIACVTDSATTTVSDKWTTLLNKTELKNHPRLKPLKGRPIDDLRLNLWNIGNAVQEFVEHIPSECTA